MTVATSRSVLIGLRSFLIALGVPVAVSGVFLFLAGENSAALGVSVMLAAAACIVGWMALSALARNHAAGRRSLGAGVAIGVIGLLFLSSFRQGTNGGAIGLVATSCGALFFVGGLVISLLAPRAGPDPPEFRAR